MARERIGQTIDGWQQLIAALNANAEELAHLGEPGARMADLLRRALELSAQQAALTASKQEITKELQGVLDQGRTLSTFLRGGVKEKYGRRSEKLLEFRMRPFRGLRRQRQTEPPSPEPEPPAVAPASPDKQS